ncbi:MAG: chemotaxis protein CheW [Eubacterium sp.]|nr:chemotaxis protein CheW [Eubacterium sp.]
MREFVCFFIKGREFGVDVSRMKTIANAVTIEPREGLPDFVKGIVNHHGEQVPLIDVEQLLSIPDPATKKELKHVIFISELGSFCIESDGVSEIINVEDSAVSGVPSYFSKSETDYASSVVQKPNRSLVVVIDPDKMLSDAQRVSLKKLMDEIEKERIEQEKRRREEERRRKEEEKRKREEEIAKMQAEQEKSEGGAGEAAEPETADEETERSAEPETADEENNDD